ncbi:hypothetical protein EN45_068140 [Penicillium chrysogenum]|uniref:Uncharacterized protein n=1 Tax=Penicillium chrysogenum TaxID=5076 RepID=A0A167TGB3_PENCH|nr:hypothetical protein EN45_068140 [Penicillium chrysogenum]
MADTALEACVVYAITDAAAAPLASALPAPATALRNKSPIWARWFEPFKE